METRRVVWSDINLDFESWRDDLQEQYPTASEDELVAKMYEINNDYLEDDRNEMNVCVGSPIIIIADIGKWDGRHTGYREIESGCLKDCLYTELDGVTWYVDNKGDFRMDGYHHDGHNYYLYRRYRDDATPEAIEEFQGKILDHTLTEEDIDRVTVRLGDDIAKIYGFTLPDQAKNNQERSDAR